MFNSKLERDIIETRNVNKHFRTTSKSIRDFERLKRRIKKVGIKMDLVTAYLENMYGHHLTTMFLLELAADLEKKINIEIDRLARRNRQALLCWYAENWDKIQPLIVDQRKDKIISQAKKIEKNEGTDNQDQVIDVSDLNQLLNFH